jgi:S-phase kinase-associated protein 1
MSLDSESTQPLSLDNSNNDSVIITLVSNDNKRFECTFKEIQCSTMLTSAFNDLNNTDDKEIILSNIDSSTLFNIVKFLKYHNGTEPPLPEKPVKSKEMKEITTEWMAKFIDEVLANDTENLYKLISAANYLFINSLLHICCAKVASLIKGLPLDEIKPALIPNSMKNNTA